MKPSLSSARATHIAVFLPNLHAGGAEKCLRTLAGGFAAQGRRVDLVLARAEGPLLAEVDGRVRVVDLGASGVLRALPRLARYLRHERPQALLSALDHVNLTALLARRCARSDTRIVVSVRTNLSRACREARHQTAARVLPGLVRRFYPQAEKVVAVSEGVAADLIASHGLSPAQVCVVPNPTVTPALAARAAEPVTHPWFADGTSVPVVLAVGRLHRAKDYPTLLRAFAQVRRELPARLLILGEGEERPALEALCRELGLEEVGLPGFAPNPYAFMARASLFVLSSEREGLPNALIEAMACGTPVVATDCESGPREILEAGRWGPLVPVGDADALAQAMLGALRAPQPREALMRRSQDFSLERSVQQYLTLLEGAEGAA